MKEGERGPFFPKLRVRIKDNNSSPHGKSHRFLSPFSCKFPDLNFALYGLYIYLCGAVSLGYLWCDELRITHPVFVNTVTNWTLRQSSRTKTGFKAKVYRTL